MTKKNKAFDAAAYTFRQDEHILIDANIWLYLQPPTTQPTPGWAVVYSQVYANLLKAKAVPVIDALIMSEYLNRYLRIEYNARWKDIYPKFKHFRGTNEGLRVAKSAVDDMQIILREAGPRDTKLQNMSLVDVFHGIESGILDFNDGILIENCVSQQWTLLTHDADMITGGIHLLTTNQKLLRSCN